MHRYLQKKEIRKTTSEVLRKTQHVTAEYTEELTEGYSLLIQNLLCTQRATAYSALKRTSADMFSGGSKKTALKQSAVDQLFFCSQMTVYLFMIYRVNLGYGPDNYLV
jgi:hypothetical protein